MNTSPAGLLEMASPLPTPPRDWSQGYGSGSAQIEVCSCLDWFLHHRKSMRPLVVISLALGVCYVASESMMRKTSGEFENMSGEYVISPTTNVSGKMRSGKYNTKWSQYPGGVEVSMLAHV